jgi:carbamoyl-phosphate synthase large subunit
MITSVGGAMVPAALIELRRSTRFELRLIGVNAGAGVAAERIVDAFYRVPLGDAPDYVAALLDIVEREGVDVVLPWSDEEALALSGASEALAELGAVAIVSPPQCLSLITNKFATYRALGEAGLAVPEFTVVRSVDELAAALGHYGHPERTVVVKPATGRGGRGLYALCGDDDPPPWLGSGARETRLPSGAPIAERLGTMLDGDTLVMPCLDAPVYDVDVLASRGRVRALSVRRRVNPTGIPFEGNRIITDPEIVAYATSVAEIVGLDSLHDIDLMTGADGGVRVLEVNPRPSGSLVATLIAGVPLLDAAIAQVLGREWEFSATAADVDIITFTGAIAVAAAPGDSSP